MILYIKEISFQFLKVIGHLLWEIILEILLLYPRKASALINIKWNNPKLEKLGLAFDSF